MGCNLQVQYEANLISLRVLDIVATYTDILHKNVLKYAIAELKNSRPYPLSTPNLK